MISLKKAWERVPPVSGTGARMTGGPRAVQGAEDAVLALAPPSPLALTSLGRALTFPEISGEGRTRTKRTLPSLKSESRGPTRELRQDRGWSRDECSATSQVTALSQQLEARAGRATNSHEDEGWKAQGEALTDWIFFFFNYNC